MEDAAMLTRRHFLQATALGSGSLVAGQAVAPGSAAPPAAPPVASAKSYRVPDRVRVMLAVNGAAHGLSLDPRTTLLDALREEIGIAGTKKGCDRGRAAPAPCWSTAGAWCRA